jgi:hypothetical protein
MKQIQGVIGVNNAIVSKKLQWCFVSQRLMWPYTIYGIRKHRDYRLINPGDLVQVDTLDIRPFGWTLHNMEANLSVLLLQTIFEVINIPFSHRPEVPVYEGINNVMILT